MGSPLLGAGVVAVAGTVAASGRLEELRARFPEAEEVDAGAVIAPAPANAHTHLDMSRYAFRALPYFRWIPEVVLAQRHLRGLEGMRLGLEMLRGAGAAAAGDIVWDEDAVPELLQSGPPGVAHWEVFAPDPLQASEVFARTRRRIEGWRRFERPGGMRLGLSPHTPFTVSAPLLRMLAEYARSEALPLQIHVGEHPAELQMFAGGGGPLEESLGRMGVPPLARILGREPEAGLTPLRHLHELGVLEAKPTLVHMANLGPGDLETLADSGCAVVSCPRSNAALACGAAPLEAFSGAGITWALGTDSVASGSSLDVKDEVAAVWARYPGLDPRLAVRAAVTGGRRVLGLEREFIRRGERFRREWLWGVAAGALPDTAKT